MATIMVTVSGPTGSGKSAVMGEIEIALRAIGITVEHGADFQAEKNMTHADWARALDECRPTVRLREMNLPAGDPEFIRALWLAEQVLDRPWADPDGDLAVLARQLLRTIERARIGVVP